MSMVLKNNTAAMWAMNELNRNDKNLSKSLKKVASGMKTNGAVDDASGWSISEGMRKQIRTLEQDKANVQNGSSLLKVADGAIEKTIELLRTMKEKAINAANDSNTDADRAIIQKELDQSIDQINDNAATQYNGMPLIDGSRNQKIDATTTALTNGHLHETTSEGTRLIDMKDRGGQSLEIFSTDRVTISFVTNGESYSSTFEVGESSIATLINNANKSFGADSTTAINAYKKNEEDLAKAAKEFEDKMAELISKIGTMSSDEFGRASAAAADKLKKAKDDAAKDLETALRDVKLAFNFKYSTTSFIGIDGSGNSVYTADGRNALTISSKQNGMYNQISGFNIQISDNKGIIKTAANTALDDFNESIRAQNDSSDNAFVIHIGTESAQSVKIGLTNMGAVALGLQGQSGKTVSVGTREKANVAVSVFDYAIQKALDQQTTIGAMESRLEETHNNLVIATENTISAESVIRDADMAKEMTEYTRNSVLSQASQSMLSQANQQSSGALSLLQG
ncbi:MAG: flagellin [Selenomonadaceae bacterium]|nr:flagellin [Selenomonadaceae bacterium]